MSFYVDEELLYLGDTDIFLPNLMGNITKFGEFSVFNINWPKSILMPFDPLALPLPRRLPNYYCYFIQISVSGGISRPIWLPET